MNRMVWLLPLCLLPAACAAPMPAGPTVLAVPGKDKTFAQFQQDEGSCRNYAQAQIGPTSPSQAATENGVGSAAVGTALGALAGAAVGSTVGSVGAGAAIGAGTGLLVGSSVGAGNAAYSGAQVQQRYDFSYIQCMTAKVRVYKARLLPPMAMRPTLTQVMLTARLIHIHTPVWWSVDPCWNSVIAVGITGVVSKSITWNHSDEAIVLST